MLKLSKLVIVRQPRKNPAFGILVLGAISLFCLWCDFYFVVRDFIEFNGVTVLVKTSSIDVRILSNIFFVFTFISFVVAVIRNNNKSQPVETLLFVAGVALACTCVLAAAPITDLWANLHGYHFDHFEAAHKGGWYIFRLNGA